MNKNIKRSIIRLLMVVVFIFANYILKSIADMLIDDEVILKIVYFGILFSTTLNLGASIWVYEMYEKFVSEEMLNKDDENI